jgi:hypothetical protein
VTLITTAFEVAGRARAKILGMQEHPLVAMPHPLASRSALEVQAMAETLVDAIAGGLTRRT